MKLIRLFAVSLLLIAGQAQAQVLDPKGCRATPYTTVEWNALGYESLNDPQYNVNPNDNVDDTAGIQAAIDNAWLNRRSVVFFDGTNGYRVSDTLHSEQDLYDRNDQNNPTGRFAGNFDRERYTVNLVGSWCGTAKPRLIMDDGVDNGRSTSNIRTNPTPVIAITRDIDEPRGSDPFDATEDFRDWYQVVRNLHIITGNNTGVVGIRHFGAEGGGTQDSIIDCTGAFACLFYVPTSGGNTYNVELIGGQFGIYADELRGGTMTLTGMKISGQTIGPIAVDHYGPVVIVGSDIETDGTSFLHRANTSNSTQNTIGHAFNNSGGHLSLIDSKIRQVGAASGSGVTSPIINNTLENGSTNPSATHDGTNRSIYIQNSYFIGSDTIVNNSNGGNLFANNATSWKHVEEYSYTGDSENLPTKLIDGTFTNNTWYVDQLLPRNQSITITENNPPPSDLITQHLHADALCSPETDGVINVTLPPYNAVTTQERNGETADSTQAFQDALNDAGNIAGGGVVFVPSGPMYTVTGTGAVTDRYVEAYQVRDTLTIPDGVHLCGVARAMSIISAGRNGGSAAERDTNRWIPTNAEVDSLGGVPVIQTDDGATSSAVMMNITIGVPAAENINANYVYHTNWRSGPDSVYKDNWNKIDFAQPAGRRSILISGAGRFYGTIQQGGYPPSTQNNGGGQSFRTGGTATGAYVLNPASKHMEINGSTGGLTFYSFHCQHLTIPEGSQCDIVDSSNVTIYGIKQEQASTPTVVHDVIEDNVPEETPVWMRIINSSSIELHGYESHSEYSLNRAAIEISGDSTDITISNMGRRSGSTVYAADEWGLVSEDFEGRFTLYDNRNSMMGLFKSAFGTEPATPIAPPPPVATDFASEIVRPLAPALSIFSMQTLVSAPLAANVSFATLDGYSFSMSPSGNREMFMDKTDGVSTNIIGWSARTFIGSGNHSFAQQRTHRFTGSSAPIQIHPDDSINLSSGEVQYFRFEDYFTGVRYFIKATIDANGLATFEFTKSAF